MTIDAQRFPKTSAFMAGYADGCRALAWWGTLFRETGWYDRGYTAGEAARFAEWWKSQGRTDTHV